MKSAIACALVGVLCFPPFAPVASDVDISHDYGVFLGASPEDIDYMKNYDTIVIDAQYFTEDQIAQLKEGGHTVFSYLNIGSVENFRPYYSEYEDLTFADYDNWPEERWVDVSEDEWQEFILEDLAPSILDKGVDGLFVDNVDVYYVASEEGLYDGDDEDIYYGVENILESLADMDTYVCINGGDTFVWEYYDRDGDLEDIMDAVNQESVFSSIEDYENDIFGEADEEDHEWYTEYIEMCADECIDVYLLEYTTDEDLIAEIDAYCREMEFAYYASPSVGLVAGEADTETTPVIVPEDNEVDPAVAPETYGVFLGAASDEHHLTAEDIEYMRNFDTIVIDAMYCSEEEIAALKADGHTVWSYLNVGSLEDFREGYEEFHPYTFTGYPNWPEERFIDVSETSWQNHIIELANELEAKGVDGFYIDNLDVYDVCQNEGQVIDDSVPENEREYWTFDFSVDSEALYNGIVRILTAINDDDTYILINSGADFVERYAETGDIRDIMDGVNQESVFSTVEDFDNDIFVTQDSDEHEYCLDYVEMVGDSGLGVYLLEYTVDTDLIAQIDAYCAENGFSYYVSDSIKLLALSNPDENNVEAADDVNVEVIDDEDDEDDEVINLEDYDDVVLDDDYGDFDFYADVETPVETEPEVIELDPVDEEEPVEVVVDNADIAELESDSEEVDDREDYGVFLGASAADIEYMKNFDIIVIDAQYYSASQIAELKADGRTVLSYINVGSVEDFRPYYGQYEHLTFADYDNWPEERWVDVSSQEWQSFILNTLAPSLLSKGVDGFFVDNVDVYYVAAEEGLYDGDPEDIFDGVANILRGLQGMNTYVSINGGDTFVTRYAEEVGPLTDIMDAVNQESVFSTINDYDRNILGTQDSGDHAWYIEYIELVGSQGLDVYLLEYTTDEGLIDQIDSYCEANDFTYYVSSTVQLLAE